MRRRDFIKVVSGGILLGRRKFLYLAAGAAAQPAVARIARAQSYPARPVRVIVPYAPGGPTDVFGRLIAQKLSEQLGRQFFVENIGGAGGNIGMGRAARADRDGHTVVMVATPLAINPSLYDSVPFDPIKDFDPVTLAVSTTTVLAVHPSVPAQTTRDLVVLIRANPGKYSFASPGTGTPSHLLGELFRLSLNLDLVHVPFNSGGLAIGSNLAGHTPLSFGTPPPALPHLKDGKLRALAVTSKARVPTLPDVPTMAEAGYPGVEGESWFAVAVPAGTPKEIVALLNREIVKAMALPDVKERLTTLGFDSIASSPEEFGARIRTDTEKWAKVIRAANIKPE
jgi:tripartite-type tricarboxylate transporter receptor subunit TctC